MTNSARIAEENRQRLLAAAKAKRTPTPSRAVLEATARRKGWEPG